MKKYKINIINKTNMSTKKIEDVLDFVIPQDPEFLEFVNLCKLQLYVTMGNGSGGSVRALDATWNNNSKKNNGGLLAVDVQVCEPGHPWPYHENYRWSEENQRRNPITYASNMKRCRKSSSLQDWINTLILSNKEAMVHNMAHEFWHVWQICFHEEISDLAADVYAIRKQREWRKLHNNHDYSQYYGNAAMMMDAMMVSSSSDNRVTKR